ncbi:MAG: 50S ribosomal protein L15 [Candidatus Krumholzibacteria bacterium]|nr:50S ribosomal protein L15 [Candidatus Krumholzibacteria bacterium]MDH4338139.1 50S ribosomal protein L15 [Candidatus Krumholzibacteria bacterium]MDH5270967.1 50S ribosomal protein L15 [Candidatus Krumholzibacteria bacterium]MDH5627785.1 50S ribosomal protein L15 [Candidatus Krumholzibacteria bacterium]
MDLSKLKPASGAKKRRKRVGCGPGSGHGKTSTKGHKGTQARSGNTMHAWYEGGQMPLQRRLPKRGFTNIFRVAYQVVNLVDLERFEANATVDVDKLLESGLVRKASGRVKLLGNGEINKVLNITVHACSKKAREAVEKAGGQVNIVK